MINTPEQLLNKLLSDPVLMGLVGLYKFTDETEASSIAILGSAEYIDGLRSVEGLEIIISRLPNATSTQIYSGCTPSHKTWTLHLIQYESGNNAMNAADHLVQLYPGTTYSNLGSESMSEVAGIAQVAVTIPSNVNL